MRMIIKLMARMYSRYVVRVEIMKSSTLLGLGRSNATTQYRVIKTFRYCASLWKGAFL